MTDTPAAADSAPAGGVRRLLTSALGPLTARNILSWLMLILLVLFIRWLFFEPFSVPTGSMEPTLHGDPRFLRGDRLGVNKLIYGPRVPFMRKRLFHLWEPKRWDIVVFKTLDPKAEHTTLVKRIVGLPGERIEIKDGAIWADGVRQEPPPGLKDVLHYTRELEQTPHDVDLFALMMADRQWHDPELNPAHPSVQKLYEELARLKTDMAGANPLMLDPERVKSFAAALSPGSRDIVAQLHRRRMNAQYPLRYGVMSDDQYAVVPPNHYLVCGDNSPESADGRWFGWLPNDNILGRAFCIWWPLPRRNDFTGFSRTWYGAGALYGVPAAVVAYELASFIRRRRNKKTPAA